MVLGLEVAPRQVGFIPTILDISWCILILMVKKAHSTTLTLDAQGRVLLPRPLRQALGLGPGARLVALVEDGRLVLTPWERLEEELWAELADVQESLAEELLRERRLEAAKAP